MPPLESIAFDALSLPPPPCYTHLYTELYETNESGSPRIDQSRGRGFIMEEKRGERDNSLVSRSSASNWLAP